MPLRDHFRPPLEGQRSWEELHGQWPVMIVMALTHKPRWARVSGPRRCARPQVSSARRGPLRLAGVRVLSGDGRPAVGRSGGVRRPAPRAPRETGDPVRLQQGETP
jgi:hypothetical protein